MRSFYLSILFYFFIFQGFSQNIEQDTIKARTYLNESEDLNAHANYDEALAKIEQAKSIYSKYKLDALYYTCELEHADVLISQQEFTEAISVLNSGMNAIKSSKGENNELYADYCSKKGMVYYKAAEYPKAKDEWIKSMGIRKKIFGPDHLKVADSYNDIGSLYVVMGEYYSGLKLHQMALKIREEKLLENDMKIAFSLMYIGSIYLQMENPDLSLDYFSRSLKIMKVSLKSNDPKLAELYRNMGLVCYQSEAFDQAEKYYNKALSIAKENFGDDQAKTAYIYSGLAKVLHSKGEYDKALEYQTKALSIFEEKLGRLNPAVLRVLIDIGTTYLNQNDFDKAKEYFTLATKLVVDIFGTENKEVAQIYIELGNIYYNKVNDLTPMNFFIKGLQIQEKIYNGVHPDIAETYMQIGHVYTEQEDYYQALDYYKKCLELRIRIYGDKHPKTSEIYNVMADLYLKKSDLSNAQVYLQKALVSNIETFNSNNINMLPDIKSGTLQIYDRKLLLETLSKKGEVYKQIYFRTNNTEDLKEAYKAYDAASALLSRIRHSSMNMQEKRELKIELSENYEKAITGCMLLYKKTNDPLYFNKAFEFSEKYKAGILADMLSYVDMEEFALMPDSVVQYEKDLSGDIFYYRQKEKEETEDPILQKKLVEQEEKYDAFITMTENEYEDYYVLKFAPYTISVRDMQDQLDDSTMIISYFTTELSKYLYVFTIKKQDVYMYFMNKDAGYDQNIKNFKSLLVNKNVGQMSAYKNQAHQLYEILMPEHLKNDNTIKKLIIFPDDQLVSIPFETLLTEDYTGSTDNWPDYPFLIKKYGISYFYSGKLFHKTLYNKTGYQQDDTLDVPEYDVFDHISVLSSSETDFVKKEEGEGVINLSYALLYEEIENIIAPMWPYSDKNTGKYMTQFYKDYLTDIEKTSDFSRVFRDAKLKLIREGTYANPYYWCPFILIGE